MKYNIVIKDNETGEIYNDVDTDVIYAGIAKEEGSDIIMLSHAPIKKVAHLIYSYESAIKELLKKDIKLKFAVGFMRYAAGEVEEETGTTE